jgi:hypothetical protein
MSTLNVANATVTDTGFSGSVIVKSLNVLNNAIILGNSAVNSSAIAVGNVVANSSGLSTPLLVVGGQPFSGFYGGIIDYQEFALSGTWNNPYYTSGGLTYTYYTQGSSTNPTTEAGLNALFNTLTVSPTVTFGGSGAHSTNINWSSDGSSGAGGATGSKPAYLPASQFSWMVEGYILAPETGTYFFGCDGDDAMDVFVNGVNVANFYGGHGFSGSWNAGVGQFSGSISLTAGQYYTFRARMQDGGSADGFQVGWRKPSDGSISLIPSSAFFTSTTGTPAGLTGTEQVVVYAIAGGGGGSSNNSVSIGGGGGGAGVITYELSDLGSTVAVTVGTAGTASRTTTTATGTAGSGSNSSFGSFTVCGGAGASPTTGGGGGGTFSNGATTGAGGTPLGGATGAPGGASTFGGGGGGNAAGAAGGASIYGGGGGARASNSGGASIYGGGGGGASLSTTVSTGGASVFAGSGGAANTLGAYAGVVPGGGGGASNTAANTGARGEVRVWVIGLQQT